MRRAPLPEKPDFSIRSIALTDGSFYGSLGLMLDAMSLDQLRTFIAAVDEGSFSAAGRKLLRAQSVISQTIGNLEEQLGVTLFDRGGKYPKLTAEGQVLLTDARAIISRVDAFKAKARGMLEGLERQSV